MSAQRGSDACPSQFLLDRLSAGELSDVERASAERHTSTCLACQRGLAARTAERASFSPDPRLLLRLAPVDALHRPAPPLAPRRWVAMAAPALLCAAGALLFLRARAPDPETSGAGAGAEISRRGTPKGGLGAKVLVERSGSLTAIEPEHSTSQEPAILHPGDRLQAVVRIPDARFVAMYSLDAAGTRSRYAPPETPVPEAPMARLEPGGEQPLPNSTILDDVLGPETLAVFACAELHGDAELRARVTEGEVAGCEVVRFFAVKAAR